jgi:hypothetical protein
VQLLNPTLSPLLLQVLEVETFIPMVLQRQEDGVARLKRVILIGAGCY